MITPSPARKAIQQSLLNRSYAHVITQGGPSAIYDGDSSTCLYRHPDNGRSCAAAPFIRTYSPRMEKSRWSGLLSRAQPSERGRWGYTLEAFDPHAVDEFSLVCDLQAAHDFAANECKDGTDADFLAAYRKEITSLVKRYNLEMPPEPTT